MTASLHRCAKSRAGRRLPPAGRSPDFKHATLADALTCIVGYSCFNDGSVRKFQRRTSQWDMGKNFDRTGGFGPWMVSADELPAGAKGLKIESRLNGQVMQSDNTANMMFPVAETVVDLDQKSVV